MLLKGLEMATPWPEILLNELFRFWKDTYVDHNTNILQLKIKKHLSISSLLLEF